MTDDLSRLQWDGNHSSTSPYLEDWLENSKSWFKDWGDSDWESHFMKCAAHNLNEFGYDPFGMSPASIKKLIPFFRFLYKTYFRVQAKGITNIPAGRVMLVSNHGGQLPFDGSLIAAAVALDGDPPRILRSMVERWVPSLPFVNIFMARLGQVLGDPSNSKHLLENEEAILVFPEGVRGISKTYKHRYQTQEFGHGFLRLALETNTPIVPVAVLGTEEAMPAFFNSKFLAKLLRSPSFPITPTFPWLLAFGLIPYPVKVSVTFGEPMTFKGDPHEEDEVIQSKVDRVKDTIQGMLDRGIKERRSIFRW
jgi:1-acyl-sn-glycerol-3-phosphate acyltransferase